MNDLIIHGVSVMILMMANFGGYSKDVQPNHILVAYDRLMYPFYSPIIVDLCWFNMIYYDSIVYLIRLNPMN